MSLNMPNSRAINPKKQTLLLIPLVVLFSFGLDSYIPFIIDVKKDLNLTESTAQLSLSIYFFALAFGQIFIGLLSDYIGRKKTLYLSMFIFVLASLYCAFSTSGAELITGRFFQGLGACGLRVCAYAIIKDQYSGDQVASNLTTLYSAISISPMFAPLVGGLVGSMWHWQAIFLMLAILGLLCLSCITPLNETYQKQSKKSFIKHILDILNLFNDKYILFFGCVTAAGISVMFCFVSIIPYVILTEYALSNIFIYITFIVCGIGMLITGYVSKFFIKRFGRMKAMTLAFTLNLMVLATMFLLTLFNNLSIILFYITIVILLSSAVIINGCAIAIGVSSRKTLIGLAISIIGVLGYGLAAINGWLISLIGINMFSYSIIVGVFYLIIICLYLFLFGCKKIQT